MKAISIEQTYMSEAFTQIFLFINMTSFFVTATSPVLKASFPRPRHLVLQTTRIPTASETSSPLTSGEIRRLTWPMPGKRSSLVEESSATTQSIPNWFGYARTFFGTAKTTSNSTTSHPMNRARRLYTVVTLLYDLCLWPCHFDYKWEGWEQITRESFRES